MKSGLNFISHRYVFILDEDDERSFQNANFPLVNNQVGVQSTLTHHCLKKRKKKEKSPSSVVATLPYPQLRAFSRTLFFFFFFGRTLCQFVQIIHLARTARATSPNHWEEKKRKKASTKAEPGLNHEQPGPTELRLPALGLGWILIMWLRLSLIQSG